MRPGSLAAAATNAFAVGTGPEWVTLVDVSSDGLRDLLTANYSTNDVTVRMNNGAGGFGPATSYPMGNGPYTVTAGDFNFDGFPDMVTANNASNTISVRTSYGFLFSPATSYATGSQPACAAVGRLNGDFFDDIVTANFGSNTVSVFLGDGSGGFAAKVDYPVAANPNWVAVGDMNGDGKADLVTANYGANSVSVLLGTGTGTFGPKTDYATAAGPLTLSLGDMNGDNRLDVVTANAGSNTMTRLLNGPGGLGSSINVPAFAPVTVVLRDVNADGLLDAVVCSDLSNVIRVFPGDGAGSFFTAVNFPVGTTPYGVAIDDVSNDGVPDLVSANFGSNDVTVIRMSVTESGSPCPTYQNLPQSRIVLIDMSASCNVNDQLQAAQTAGASAAIVVYTEAVVYDLDLSGITIPVFMVTNADGSAMRSEMFKGPVNVTLTRSVSLARESAIDNQIVAHEWAHYMSNRLVGNANGLSNKQGSGMGEGWSDFCALLMTVKPEDAAAPGNSNFNGVYQAGAYGFQSSVLPNNCYYFGTRRYPYSTDMSKSPLTFRHITSGQSLPAGPPRSPWPSTSDNTNQHNVGEVWCAALWECYTALLRDTGRLTFAQARDRMRQYFVASLKLTPGSPTMIEARDALLSVAYAGDPADYALFLPAFAKRGFGTGAVAPTRNSNTLTGVTERFTAGGDLVAQSMTLNDIVHSCDSDGLLDAKESALLTVTLYNPVGSVNLNQTTGTVSSPTPGLTFPSAFTFSPSHPFGTTTGTARLSLGAVAGLQTQYLTVQFTDPAFAQPGMRTTPTLAQWGNADEATSASDNVEERVPAWTAYGSPLPPTGPPPWQRVETSTSPLNHTFFVEVVPTNNNSDRWLVTPPLHVGSGAFGFSFKHAHGFAVDGGNCDGGVVEISTDNGANWTDIGASLSPGYNGTVGTCVGRTGPLAGRAGFVGASSGFPTLQTATASLGTAYANQTVLIRFRFGSVELYPAGGWYIDDFSFTGITNTPLVTLVADPGPCTPLAVDDQTLADLSFAIAGPNPVAADPSFRFALPHLTTVHIGVYDISGRCLATLADGSYSAGEHVASWKSAQVQPGIYFARMIADGRMLTTRMVLLAR